MTTKGGYSKNNVTESRVLVNSPFLRKRKPGVGIKIKRFIPSPGVSFRNMSVLPYKGYIFSTNWWR